MSRSVHFCHCSPLLVVCTGPLSQTQAVSSGPLMPLQMPCGQIDVASTGRVGGLPECCVAPGREAGGGPASARPVGEATGLEPCCPCSTAHSSVKLKKGKRIHGQNLYLDCVNDSRWHLRKIGSGRASLPPSPAKRAPSPAPLVCASVSLDGFLIS